MSELHDALERFYRLKLRKAGYKVSGRKKIFHGWIPDIFGEKFNRAGHLKEEVVVEIETANHVTNEQTSYQLALLDSYIKQKKKAVRKIGLLVIDDSALSVAKTEVRTLFFDRKPAFKIIGVAKKKYAR